MSPPIFSKTFINGESCNNIKKNLTAYVRSCYINGAYSCVTKVLLLKKIKEEHAHDIVNNKLSKNASIKHVFNNFRRHIEDIIENELSPREICVYKQLYKLLDRFDKRKKPKYWLEAVKLLCNAKKSKFVEKVWDKFYDSVIRDAKHAGEDFYVVQTDLISSLHCIKNDRIDNNNDVNFKSAFPSIMETIIYMIYLWHKNDKNQTKRRRRKKDFEKFWEEMIKLCDEIPTIQNYLKLKQKLFKQRTDHKRQRSLVTTATLITLYVVSHGKKAIDHDKVITQSSSYRAGRISKKKHPKRKKNDDVVLKTLVQSIKIKNHPQNRQLSHSRKRKTNHEKISQKSKKMKYDISFGQAEINLEMLDVNVKDIRISSKKYTDSKNLPFLYAMLDDRRVCLKEVTRVPGLGRHQACLEALKQTFGIPSLNVMRYLYDHTFDAMKWKFRSSNLYSVYIVIDDVHLVPLYMCKLRVSCNEHLINALCKLLLFRILLGVPETDMGSICLDEENEKLYSTKENEIGTQSLTKYKGSMDSGVESIFHFLVLDCRLSMDVLLQCITDTWHDSTKRVKMIRIIQCLKVHGMVTDDYDDKRIKRCIKTNGALLLKVCLSMYSKYTKIKMQLNKL